MSAASPPPASPPPVSPPPASPPPSPRRPKVSVIMPSFNQAHFLRRAIDSVLSQQGEFDLELLVMDGGSTDGSVEVLQSYGDRIRWVSQRDKGQSDALNKGIARTDGDVIGWLNSDDTYEPGALAAVAGVFAAEPQTGWVYGKVRFVDETGREIRRWITWYKNLRMRRYRYAKLLAENPICQMSVFWRRELGERAGEFPTDLKLATDYDYWLRLGRYAPGRFIDAYLGCFRLHGSSMTMTQVVPTLRAELDHAIRHAEGRYRAAILLHYLMFLRTAVIYTLMGVLNRIKRHYA